jgi:hypothetical protein
MGLYPHIFHYPVIIDYLHIILEHLRLFRGQAFIWTYVQILTLSGPHYKFYI